MQSSPEGTLPFKDTESSGSRPRPVLELEPSFGMGNPQRKESVVEIDSTLRVMAETKEAPDQPSIEPA